MSKKDKNKFRLNPKSKILVLGFILFILVGIFSPIVNVQASTNGGVCYFISAGKQAFDDTTTETKCNQVSTQHQWLTDAQIAAGTKSSIGGNTTTFTPATPSGGGSPLQQTVDKFTCSIVPLTSGTVAGCFVQFFYYTFYTIASWLLAIAAIFFNALVYLTLQSTLYTGSKFIPKAWAVVRDLSNIFFILILLYIAIKIILDIGASEAKKMIINVVLIALLINFSMFFTKVVIDSSNIMALIFYNKLNVQTNVKTGQNVAQRIYESTFGEKDVSGALVNNFSPGELLQPDFFEKAGITVPGGAIVTVSNDPPVGIMLGLILLYGAIMGFAAYAFFIAGVSFVGRLIELWMLIIFSPFAFLSWTIPELKSIGGIGWTSWWDKLLKTAFMAPIFMFFMYLIFLFGNASLIKDLKTTGTTFFGEILIVLIPAVIILMLLRKATDYAKKGAGQVGEALTKFAGTALGVAGGLAVGAATGGAALALRGSVGNVAANLAESERFRGWAARSRIGTRALKMTSGLATGSFDARGIKIAGKGLSDMGLKNVGKAQEGGYAKKRADRAKELETFVDKNIDTSDYGKAQLTRGRMSAGRAATIETQLIRGGMTVAAAAGHRANLVGNGIDAGAVSGVARYLNAGKREQFADRLDRRSSPTYLGNFYGNAQRRNAMKRIAANKIRKDAPTQQTQANMAQAMAAWAAAGGAPAAPAPAAPAGGGAGGGGGAPHP